MKIKVEDVPLKLKNEISSTLIACILEKDMIIDKKSMPHWIWVITIEKIMIFESSSKKITCGLLKIANKNWFSSKLIFYSY